MIAVYFHIGRYFHSEENGKVGLIWKFIILYSHKNQTNIHVILWLFFPSFLFWFCFITFFLAHLSWKLKWGLVITSCLFLSVCKLFNFSSSSPELLGQFQTNYEMAKIHKQNLKIFSRTTGQISTKLSPKHLFVKRFWFLQTKSHTFFKGEIIRNSENTLTKLKNLLLQNHWADFNKSWHKHPWMIGIQVSLNEEPINSH